MENNYSNHGPWYVATGNLRAMPAVYDILRSYAISTTIFGDNAYKPNIGFLAENVPTVMELTADYYDPGANVFMYHTVDEVNALMPIKNGKAAYLSLTNDPTYIDHGVAIINYHYYTHTSGWWIF